MKFNFKIQQYQTDAVDAVVRVFNGQPHYDRVSYIRDLGKHQAKQMRMATTDEEMVLLSDAALLTLRWKPARAKPMFTSKPCLS